MIVFDGSGNVTGQFVLPGGAQFSGVLDIADNGVVTQGGQFQIGGFTVDTNTGRGIAAALPSSPSLGNVTLSEAGAPPCRSGT